ncbi:MAG TPA: hypothetical protein VD866_18110 [Urbifossiella sp.]|nr:hypothetical protein [Urbifossiella sp.]
MSTAKAAALAMIQKLPDDATWEKITELLTLRAVLEQGVAEIDAGRGIPHDQVMKEMDEWLASPSTIPTS